MYVSNLISEPIVSVLMTAYNREVYITEAIESILASTYANFELIIVDDHSIDNTVNIARSFGERDERIKVFVNEKNLGDYPNRNKAASYAKGSFLMYVDSDDTIQPEAISYIVDSFNEFPEAQHSTIYYSKDITEKMLMSSSVAIRKHFFENNMLACGPGARVFRKSYYFKMNGYPEDYGPANDMYFNIKTASNAPILLMPYSYLNYRIHNQQENKNQYAYLYQGYKYFDNAMKLPELPLTIKERNYLLLKSKRRFLINTIKYLKRTGNILKMLKAFKLANFGFKDILLAIFQF